jgi:hypothetical protein
MQEAPSPSLSPNLERPHRREAASLAVSVGTALDTLSTSGGPGIESIPCAKGSLFQREWVNSSNTSLNRREQFLAADQSPATKTRGSKKKRSAKAEGHKWAGYNPKSKSWYGDGIGPDGKRWRKYGFETALEASAWAIETRRPMDELSYAAATLPAAITRDVANAMSLRSKAGLTSYEEGLFAQLVRGDLRRNPLVIPSAGRQQTATRSKRARWTQRIEAHRGRSRDRLESGRNASPNGRIRPDTELAHELSQSLHATLDP